MVLQARWRQMVDGTHTVTANILPTFEPKPYDRCLHFPLTANGFTTFLNFNFKLFNYSCSFREMSVSKLVLRLLFVSFVLLCHSLGYETDCTNLRLGQYICPDPDHDHVDPKTQQYFGCTRENKAQGNLDEMKNFLLTLNYFCSFV